MHCVSPPMSSAKTVRLEVSSSGIEYSNSRMRFSFYNKLFVDSIFPNNGPEYGGSSITISGNNFLQTESVVCRIGNGENILAKWISRFAIQCKTPPSRPGIESSKYLIMELIMLQVPLVSNIMKPCISAALCQPRVSNKVKPRFFLLGTGFINSTSLLCRFGEVVVPISAYFNDTHIMCNSPAHAAGDVCLDVSNNGVDFTSDCIRYKYYEGPWIESISPQHGPLSGETLVTISGKRLNGTSTYCKFGESKIVTATSSSYGVAECRSPPHSAGYVAIEISHNGIDFSTSGVQFLFTGSAVVTGIYPSSGSESGGTNITISGNDFMQKGLLQCIFDKNYVVPAKWIARSAITCVTPAHQPGIISVEVSDNGQQKCIGSANFTYQTRAAVTTIFPEKGSVFGGAIVDIYGTGFVNSSSLTCKFGRLYIAGKFVNSTYIRCRSPARMAGKVLFQVSNNKIDFTEDKVFFVYMEATTILSIVPRSGPVSGGTKVVLHGSNFLLSGALNCKFGDVISTGIYISNTTMHCVSPPMSSAKTVRLEVSSSGIEYSNSRMRFSFYNDPIMHSISPKFGSEQGGTIVSIMGGNFFDGGSLFCRFGSNEPTRAIYSTSDHVKCVAPNNSPGKVSILVSNNGNNYVTNNNITFTYLEVSRVSALLPKTGSINGGTIVTVYGSGFSKGSKCHFGNHATPASVHNSTMLQCTSPPVQYILVVLFPLALAMLLKTCLKLNIPLNLRINQLSHLIMLFRRWFQQMGGSP